MILTVPQLQQPILADSPIATGRRAVHTHPLWTQFVYPQQVLVERTLKFLPSTIRAQDGQHISQPVIGEVQFLHPLSTAMSQRFQALLSPVPHRAQPMICLRKHMTQPQGHQPTRTQSFTIPVARKEGVKQFWHAHTHLLRNQQRNVIHSFTVYGKPLVHAQSLPHFPKLVYI